MNKVWNAARFIQMQRAANPPSRPHNSHDLKVLFEMNDAISKVTAALDGYKFNEAAKELYDFVWGDFCDWYIEASKVSPKLDVLDAVFGNILRLLHPFAPFITEELWSGMGGAGSIQFAECPQPVVVAGANAELAAQVDALYELVGAGRQLRNDYGIEPKKKINFVIKTGDDEAFFRTEIPTLRQFLNAEEVTIDRNFSPSGVTPSMVTRAATVFMVGAVDAAAERKRLLKQLEDIDRQLTVTTAKLANENFVARAAPVAVEREREKQRQLSEQREKVQALLRALQ
jgi:valyl-tRNA synthetase